MKRKILLNSILAGSAVAFMAVAGLTAFNLSNKEIKQAEALSLPTTINLKDCTETEIKTYYNALSGKNSSELSGTNLLKNLKAILQNNVQYYSYSDASNIYVITDRDWTNSPKESMSGYNSSSDSITSFSHSTEVSNNPYLHLLYCNYAVQGKTLYKGDGDVSSSSVSFDKEHAWSQSHGFDNGTSSGQNLTGAGSDLHHLKAGTQYGNRTLHSNYSYGFVKANDGDWSSKTYETLNKRGAPLFSHSSDQQTKVFEPQDSDKGDIARALLYMVACYNNYDGSTPEPANPALQLVNYVISGSTTGYSSDDITKGYYGILQDILAWHHMDPVDSYEIHRNNLIYRNYQHNRNPFIDYPEWVDYIWGVSTYNSSSQTISYDPLSTGYVDLDLDVINGYRGSARILQSIAVTKAPNKTTYYSGEAFDSTGMVVTATYDDSGTQDVTQYCSFDVDMVTVGNKNVTVTYKGKTATTPVTILECTANVSSVTLNKSSANIGIGDTLTLNATVLPVNAANKNIVWSSSDTSKATVTNGTVTGVAEGSATIYATSAADSSIKASCAITVQASTPTVLITDSLVRSDTGQTTTTYGSWANVEKSSGTVYAGISSGRNSGVTLAATATAGTPGIYNTTSVGKIRKVSVEFYSGATTGRTLTVYGSNDAISDTSSISGCTSIGTIVVGTSTEVTVSEDYAYVGVLADGSVSMNSVNFQWEKESSSSEIDVTGVTLSPTSATLEKGETLQLTPSVQPTEATNQNVSYSSSAPSVATVSESGLITAVEAGTATITVETEDGGFTANCSLTVTSTAVGSVYYERKTSISDITTGQYVICANVNGTYYPMGKTVTSNYIASSSAITVAGGKITESSGENYAVTLTVSSGTATIGLGNNKYLICNNDSTKISSSSSSENWTLAQGEHGSFRLTSSAATTRSLAYYTQYSRFAAYISTNITSTSDYYDLEFFKYVEDASSSYNIDTFVDDFLNRITCDSTGNTTPVFASGYSWSQLKAKFQSLTSAEQTELTNLAADEHGNNKEKCVAKYDYIIKKYGVATYENFMSRTTKNNSNLIVNKVNNQIILSITICVMITIASVGIFFYLKRRKHQ